MITIKEYDRPNKPLMPVSTVLLFPRYNGYGRETGVIEVNLADQVTCFRRQVYKTLHYMKQYREQGYENKVQESIYGLNYAKAQYKKYWKQYLKAIGE